MYDKFEKEKEKKTKQKHQGERVKNHAYRNRAPKLLFWCLCWVSIQFISCFRSIHKSNHFTVGKKHSCLSNTFPFCRMSFFTIWWWSVSIYTCIYVPLQMSWMPAMPFDELPNDCLTTLGKTVWIFSVKSWFAEKSIYKNFQECAVIKKKKKKKSAYINLNLNIWNTFQLIFWYLHAKV